MRPDQINDGGPAFPRPASEYTAYGSIADGNEAIPAQVGMTLRDAAALAALQGILAAPGVGKWSYDEVARGSFLYADAWLKAREGGR